MSSVVVCSTIASMDAGVERTGMYSQRVVLTATEFMSASTTFRLLIDKQVFKIDSAAFMAQQ